MSAPISQALWDARIPLHITHPSAPTAPFITSIPRFSYLALLLPRLSAFFKTPCSSFHFDSVLLRNLAAGLLVDLYQPSLPWRLVVNDGVSWDISDTFLNAAKEVRRSTGPGRRHVGRPRQVPQLDRGLFSIRSHTHRQISSATAMPTRL